MSTNVSWPFSNLRKKAYQEGVVDALRMERGEISILESQFLAELVRNISNSDPIVEIGTLFGQSTAVIAMHKRPEQALYSVDNYSWNPFRLPGDMHRDVTAWRLREATEALNVVLVDEDKTRFQSQYTLPPPAMVFLDADHSYEQTSADIDWAIRVNAELICGHDFGPDFPGVVKAVDERGGIRRAVGTLWTLAR
jgi:hypothetical protein